LYAVVTVLNKNFLKSLGVFQLFFLSAFVGFILISFFIKFIKKQSLWPITKGITLKYFIRGVLNIMGRTLWLFGLAEINATVATAIGYFRPIFALLFAIFFLSEKITWKVGSALLISLIGAAFVMGPVMQSKEASLLSIIAIFSAPLAWAVYDIIVKKQCEQDHWEKQTYLVFLLISIFSFPFALTNWQPLDLNLIIMISVIGFIYVLLEMSLANALKRITLVIVAPLTFIRIIFTAILAYIFLGETITISTSIGCICIIISTVIVFGTDPEIKDSELKLKELS